jgi:hypothetical protein
MGGDEEARADLRLEEGLPRRQKATKSDKIANSSFMDFPENPGVFRDGQPGGLVLSPRHRASMKPQVSDSTAESRQRRSRGTREYLTSGLEESSGGNEAKY